MQKKEIVITEEKREKYTVKSEVSPKLTKIYFAIYAVISVLVGVFFSGFINWISGATEKITDFTYMLKFGCTHAFGIVLPIVIISTVFAYKEENKIIFLADIAFIVINAIVFIYTYSTLLM